MPVADPNSTPDGAGTTIDPTLPVNSPATQGDSPGNHRLPGSDPGGHPDTAPDTVTDAAPFVAAVIDIVRAARRTGSAGRGLNGQGISLSQLVVLTAVGTAGSRGVSAIAEEAGLAQPSVTRTLDTLHRRGLVRRDRHPGDGRSTQVALTEEGARLVGGKAAEVHTRLAEIWHDVPPEAREHVLAFLSRLAKVVETLG
ncbi:DNA-binding MarR family transcriptional regulator [Thermopolyspora flexuosa]|uniref:DNA-binding MarR family transcriptional regulator n=1 Tax=Thermopolyspora flexuosa TaxID=103836 RepID=A0A543IYJ0_9ACTN|nr:DNA-binding MarR family transcriptional regulator [Thermopolyspora flexuosa]